MSLRFLLWLGLVVLLVCFSGLGLLIAVDAGHLGEPAKTALERYRDAALAFEQKYQLFRIGGMLTALVGTLGTALAAWKGLTYAERQLPERLRDVIERFKHRASSQFGDGLLSIEHVGRSEFEPFRRNSVEEFQRGISLINGRNSPETIRAFESAELQIKQQLEFTETYRKFLDSQLASAHLIRGQLHARSFARQITRDRDGYVESTDGRRAIEHYSRVIELEPNSLFALEKRAEAYDLARNDEAARQDFAALVTLAEEKIQHRFKALALRRLGEIEHRASTTSQLRRARSYYDQALSTIEQADSRQPLVAEEKSLILLAYGRLQKQRGHATTAGRLFQQLIDEFPRSQSKTIRSRVAEARKEQKAIN